MAAQLETRQNNVCFTPCRNMDELLVAEGMKGEIQGIYLYYNLLQTVIETMEDELEQRREENKEDA